MLQLRVPKKLMATIQTWGCVLLAVLCVVFSFSPLFTLETIDNAKEIEASINDVFKDTEVQVEIPEQIDISSVKLIKSISLIIDVLNVTKEIAKAAKDELTSGDEVGIIGGYDEDENGSAEKKDEEKVDIEEKVKELEELLKTEESKDTLITAFAIVNVVTSVTENNSESGSSGVGYILTIALAIIALLYVLGFTLLFPFIFAIGTLITLIKVLIKMKNPLDSAPVAAKQLNGLIILPLLSMIFQCVIPGIDFGSGTVAIFIIACISTVINIVISRTRNYPEDKNIFSLIVQGGALVGAIGFAVYFFNIIKTGILNTFLRGDWGNHIRDFAAAKRLADAINEPFEPSYAFVIDAVLILLYASFVMGSIGYFAGCVQRLTLNGSKGKYGTDAPAQFIPMSVALTVGAILPLVVSKMENLYTNLIDKADGAKSSLTLSDGSKSALTTALVGLGIMLVAEIAIAVCTRKFCKNLSNHDKQDILMGIVQEDAVAEKTEAKIEEKVEAPAEAAATVEAAPAEEAVEAPAEETEAPAEETDAPAEEAVETPAE